MKYARISFLALILASTSLLGSLSAAPTTAASRIKEIDPFGVRGPASFHLPPPRQSGEFAGKLVFGASDDIHGIELWVSDGTEAGTALMKDIHAGAVGQFDPSPASSFPSNFVAFSGSLFFVATDETHGRELWRTDGTAEGTTLFKDIRAGPQDSSPLDLLLFNGTLFFTADDGIHGHELWRTDGTEAGTVLVKDINPSPNEPSPDFIGGFTEYNGSLFFVTDDGIHGEELWKTDGTQAGTVLADIRSDGFPVHAVPFAIVNGDLLLTAEDDQHGEALWKTDGTAAGTVLVKDIHHFPSSFEHSAIGVVGGTLFFAANDGTHGNELWRSDGTEAGTFLVKDIAPGAFRSLSDIPEVAVLRDGTLLFGAFDLTHSYALWRSDGTEAGTVLVKDISPGFQFSYQLQGVTEVYGAVLLGADDSSHGSELWRSDGTEGGTVQVQDIVPGPQSSFPNYFTRLGNRILFAAHGELWVGRAAILVNQPEQAVRDLREEVQALRLPKETEQSLINRLDSAARDLAGADTRGAVRDLEEFMKKVEARSSKRISEESAADLLGFAQDIVNLLEGTI